MMSIVFIVITLITMPNGTLIGYLIPQGFPLFGGSIALTSGALEIGILLSLRFMILIYAFQLFLISTQPRDIVHTMERMRIPIDYILMFIIALRFIPTLQIEGKRIHEAQLARGITRDRCDGENPERCPYRCPARLQCSCTGYRARAYDRYSRLPDRKEDTAP